MAEKKEDRCAPKVQRKKVQKKKASRSLRTAGLLLCFTATEAALPEGVRDRSSVCALAETRNWLAAYRAAAEPGRRNGRRARSSTAFTPRRAISTTGFWLSATRWTPASQTF